MFDEMSSVIDAVVISTPDHTHNVAALAAMKLGKHVYCEKPLAHSVHEVRKMTEAARKYNVITQMGNQGHSSEQIRQCCEWVWDGAIGEVHEIHAWSNRPMGGYAFPSSIPRPKDTPPIPETLDWDLWQGPALTRPYHPLYAPIFWRGWLDYGTGALGDMGCHILDPSFWALKLESPVSVEATVSYNPDTQFWRPMLDGSQRWREAVVEYIDQMRQETYPAASIIAYEFPERDAMPPLRLTWYDGGLLPPRPEEHPQDKSFGGNGAFIKGDKGTLFHGSHGAVGLKLLPESLVPEEAKPPLKIERVPGHHEDWIRACKTGKPSSSNFDYGGPLTEMVLLGVLASQVPGTKLLWNSEKMEFTNNQKANALLKPVYREGWEL